MHAEALRLLEDHCPPGASVLDVGSGEMSPAFLTAVQELLHGSSVLAAYLLAAISEQLVTMTLMYAFYTHSLSLLSQIDCNKCAVLALAVGKH